jgi:hypothetical protein
MMMAEDRFDGCHMVRGFSGIPQLDANLSYPSAPGCRSVHWVGPSHALALKGFDGSATWYISYEYDGGERLHAGALLRS